MERAKIDRLPKEIRAELDAKIVANGFGNYLGLAAWLKDQGFEIRKSAIHNHGQKLEQRLKAIKLATEEARAIVAASPDDDNAMNDALVRLVQDRLFTFLVDLELEDIDAVKLSKVSRGIADVARASISQKKFVQETRERVKAGVAKTSEQIELVERAGGLSPDAAKKIRNVLLDIQV
jgi:Protein of unknown function (DUF3486)